MDKARAWIRLRKRLSSMVNDGLPKADIQVIKCGKAPECFSRHYGQVYVEEDREFTVQEALVDIDQLLDD